MEEEEVLRDGVEEVVGDRDKGLGEALGLEGDTGGAQNHFVARLCINEGHIQPALVEVGLKARVFARTRCTPR